MEILGKAILLWCNSSTFRIWRLAKSSNRWSSFDEFKALFKTLEKFAMKKTLIALAAVAATGAAFAQSSVTIWGVADAGVTKQSQGGVSKTYLSSSGLSSSQLGFRGTEDLGGGMSASFWLEAGMTVDNGTAAGVAFQRRSTLDLAGSFGAIRLGRDYTPSFWNHTMYDPFGTLGSGAGSNITLVAPAQANALTAARTNNGISYLYNFAANGASVMGQQGVTAQVTYALAENLSTAVANGKYAGARVGYNAGPLTLAVATAKSNAAAGTVEYKETNVGASYDLGVANVMAKFGTNDSNVAGTKFTWSSIGAKVPMGAGYIPVSYNTVKQNNAAGSTGNQFAIGYVHNLSKRTAVYTAYSKISNKNGAAYGFLGGNGGFSSGALGTATNNGGTGFDLGLRHAF
jgi:predicted porin